jgi:hypothetical protein
MQAKQEIKPAVERGRFVEMLEGPREPLYCDKSFLTDLDAWGESHGRLRMVMNLIDALLLPY